MFSRMLRRFTSLLAVTVLFAAMIPATPAVAATTFVGGLDLNPPKYMANDHTAYAIHFTATGLTPNTQYYMRGRLSSDWASGGGGSARGFTWNPTTQDWVQERENQTLYPIVTSDATGMITSNAGWFYFKVGDDKFAGHGPVGALAAGQSYMVVSLSPVGGSGTLNGDAAFITNIVDPKSNASWVHNGVATGAAAAKRAEVIKSDDALVQYSLQKTEANLLDDNDDKVLDNEDYGPTGKTGDFRMAVPANAPITVKLNQGAWAPGTSATAGPADTDIALGASDQVAPGSPTGLTAAGGDSSVTLGWNAATDSGGSGLAGYRVYRSSGTNYDPALTNTSPLVQLLGTVGADTTTYVDSTAVNGTVYTYEVRAVDLATNVGPRSASAAAAPEATPIRFEQTNSNFAYSGTWYTGSSPAYSGGSYAYNAGVAGANVQLSFEGSMIKWISTKSPIFGIAEVSIDGGAPVEVDLYASAITHRQTLFSRTNLAPGAHTVTITVTGRRNAAATRAYVGIDALDLAVALPAAVVPVRAEQSDLNMAYTGTWYTGNSPSYSGGSYAYNPGSAGAGVQLAFEGSMFKWITSKGPIFGIAEVSIDGGAPVEVDLYAAANAHRQTVFSRTNLAPGSHTAVITVTGRRNASATRSYVGIDAVDLAVALPVSVPLTRFEQSDSNMVYAGTWYTGASTSYSGGSYRYNPGTVGASVQLAFDGTTIKWITSKGPIFGIAEVSIDGGAPVEVDLYAVANAHRQTVFSRTDLAPGLHTVTIAVTGRRNASATRSYVGIDAIDLVGATQSP